jgi:hypothetical protein
VYSDFDYYYANITFTCSLPQLSAGAHVLTVNVTVYGSEVPLQPSRATFRVVEKESQKIVEIFLIPIKILRKILPF